MTHLTPRKTQYLWWLYGLLIATVAGFIATLQARFVSEPYYGDLFTTMAAGMTALMIVAWFIYSASDLRRTLGRICYGRRNFARHHFRHGRPRILRRHE